MCFSDNFGIADPDQYDWFNPVLERDTRVGVLPKDSASKAAVRSQR
jgi:hypothetical protein